MLERIFLGMSNNKIYFALPRDLLPACVFSTVGFQPNRYLHGHHPLVDRLPVRRVRSPLVSPAGFLQPDGYRVPIVSSLGFLQSDRYVVVIVSSVVYCFIIIFSPSRAGVGTLPGAVPLPGNPAQRQNQRPNPAPPASS